MWSEIASFGRAYWNNGIYCIVTAAVFFSISSSLLRPIGPDVTVFEIVAVRSALSMVLSVVTARLSHDESPLFGSLGHIHLLFLRGASGAMAMTCFYVSVENLLLSEAVALLFLNPALVAVLAFLFLGETIGLSGILGCISSIIGMVLVVRPPILEGDAGEWTNTRQLGVLMGILAAFLAAVAYTSIRKIGTRERSLTIAVWFHSTALVSSVIALLFGVFGVTFSVPTATDWVCMVVIAMCSFLAQLMISRGLQLEKAALGSAVNYLQVLFAAVLGYFLYGEPVSMLNFVGAILIFAGVLALSIRKSPPLEDGATEEEKQAILSLNQEDEHAIELQTQK